MLYAIQHIFSRGQNEYLGTDIETDLETDQNRYPMAVLRPSPSGFVRVQEHGDEELIPLIHAADGVH